MAKLTLIDVAIIGVGLIGPRHVRSVEACGDANLICLVEPNPNAAPLATELAVPLFQSVHHMLESNCRPDAAIVCTPNGTHVDVSTELLAAGIHVLVEKPLCTTIAAGRALIDAARISGKQLLVGHHRRFNPYVTAVKQALSAGVIGSPIAVSGLWMAYKPPSYYQSDWRTKAGNGGPILINLIHEVDVLQYLLGPIIRVHAERTISQRGHEVEEGVATLLKFESGLVGTFLLSDASPSGHNFESATGENPLIPRAGQDVYRIFGTEGTLSVGDMKVCKHSGEKSWLNVVEDTFIQVEDVVPFDEQIKHFIRVIRKEEGPRCTGEDGLRAVAVCDAIKRALGLGTAIDITN